MPLVHLHISQGKSDQQKQSLMRAITDAIEQSIGADRKTIRVFLHEFPLTHIMVGGVTPGGAKPPGHE
jgi:4-oxalocrotonate tautomerase